MKIILFILIFLVVVLVFSLLIKSGKIEKTTTILSPFPGNITDTFLVGAVQDGKAPNYANIVGVLGLNLWHQYTETEDIGSQFGVTRSRFGPIASGWSSREHIFTPPSGPAYVDDVKNKLDEISDKNMWSLMQRPKIEWLCYGQHSEYQCEIVSPLDDNWFYSFQTHETGQDILDGTIKVRKCSPTNNPPDHQGYVVKLLKANTEQCHRMDNIHEGNQWHGDSYCDWYIKPRVKVKTSFVMSYANRDVSIFKIKVYAQDGVTLKMNADITAKNFLDNSGVYNGDYLEEFFDPGGRSGKLDLIIPGHWGDEWEYKARGNNTSTNNADIQIEWSGNCDAWFDYVKVENDVAHNLLDTISGSNAIHTTYDTWLRSEANDIACHGESPLKFYIELSEYNNIPCIAFVSRKLKEYSLCSKNVNVMTDLTNRYSVHVPWYDPVTGLDKRTLENAGHIKRNYIDRIGATQIFMESYPFWACPDGVQKFSRLPSRLPIASGTGVLANILSADNYDDWLQENLDHNPYQLEVGPVPTDLVWCVDHSMNQDWGNFRYRMQLGDAVSKMADVPFIYMVQSHQWFRTGEVRREPTIEEMDLLSNLSVTYGARGNIFFEYSSSNLITTGSDYNRGLFDPPSGSIERPRVKNVYDQLKWDKAQEIVKRLKTKWGPYLMSFDNCHRSSYIYRIESNALISQTFFKDVNAYEVSGYPNHASTPDIICKRTGYVDEYLSQDTLTGISIVSSDTGYICGFRGNVLKTTNAGSNWIPQTTDTTLSLQDINFINANTGIAAGNLGKVIITKDGGLTWGIVITPTNSTLMHTQLKTSSDGICVGLNGRIIQTTNLGITWTLDTTTTKVGLWGVNFISLKLGYICGDSGTILFTTNGGNTWSPQNSTVTSDLKAIYFTDKDTGYSAGSFGVILKTTNAGITWQKQISGTTNNLNGIFFINNLVGTVVGDEFISSTDNGGKAWIPRLPPRICEEKRILRDDEYFDVNNVVVVGPDGLLYSSTTGGITFPDTCTYLQVANFRNPNEPATKYFMIVNRRCSPFDQANPENASGIRYVTIDLDAGHPDFNSASNWQILEIKDPSTDHLIGAFHRTSGPFSFNLEWFQPGEGKLYKIVPIVSTIE